MFFFSNDTATTEIYTLSLHDALPILLGDRVVDRPPGGAPDQHRLAPGAAPVGGADRQFPRAAAVSDQREHIQQRPDRKSTRLNSSHEWISYAVFCLKKKKKTTNNIE